MKDLILEAGQYTPKIVLKPEQRLFCFFGNSFPVNPTEFYRPVIEWFSEYLKLYTSNDEIIINFDFNYINTSSSKQIATLFMLFDSLPVRDNILINWYYNENDNDMLETGERYAGYADLKFKFTDKTIEIPIQVTHGLL
jgi:hypothetical protein